MNGWAPSGGGPDAPGVLVGSGPARPLAAARSLRDPVLALGPGSAPAAAPDSALAVGPGGDSAVGPGGAVPAGAASWVASAGAASARIVSGWAASALAASSRAASSMRAVSIRMASARIASARSSAGLRPDVAFVDGNPLLLSVEGEFVVKNLVLLAATASLALHSLGTRPVAATGHGVPDARDADGETPTRDAA